jgi:hypothetical protein
MGLITSQLLLQSAAGRSSVVKACSRTPLTVKRTIRSLDSDMDCELSCALPEVGPCNFLNFAAVGR